MDWSSDVCSSDLIRAPTFWRPNSSVSASSVAVMIRLKRPFGRNADIFGLLLRQLRQLHAELFKMQRSNLLVEMLGQHINVFLIGLTIGPQFDLRQHLIGEAGRDRKSTRLNSSH